MQRRANEFRIVTRWEVAASITEVATILQDAARFPDWWSEVYLDVKVLERGDADGVGGRVSVHSTGWLPYRLHWVATLTESRSPHGWSITATGDLQGQGIWTLTQSGPLALIDYDWRVLAEKPVLKVLSPVLSPVFGWNHRWAMAKGFDGLKREILSRRNLSTT